MTNNDKDYIRGLVTVIGGTTNDDLKAKLCENLRDKIQELIDDDDKYDFIDGEDIYNMYINWDSNSGCTIIEASMNFQAIADYVIDYGINYDNFDIYQAAEIMNSEFCERTEYGDDLFDDNGYPVDADYIIEVIERFNNFEDKDYHDELQKCIRERLANKKPKYKSFSDFEIRAVVNKTYGDINQLYNMMGIVYDDDDDVFLVRNMENGATKCSHDFLRNLDMMRYYLKNIVEEKGDN